jgi:predicted metalloprotease with PDZ domain
MTALSIVHRIAIPAPQTHLVEVASTISAEAGSALPDTLVLFMAAWTPGSYLLREYARHVEGLAVDHPARVSKIRKNAWRAATGGAERVTVRYRVYAGELTVRTNHVDATHAFLVGAALFLGVEGREDLGARVEIAAPPGWRIATSLAAVRTEGGAPEDIRAFAAPDFDTLVDSPIEMGTHREETFEVLGTPHRYAIWPAAAAGDADARRLVDDTRVILETEAKLFGNSLPYGSYDLLLHLSTRGRGGLEHGAGAALIAAPSSFVTRDGYLDLLSLVAHEVFHAWNVKRIRPAGLTPYRYGEECYTRLLWWFEGGTSYYDWRVLALSRLCTIEEYLDHLSAEIAYLDQTPGRLVHALEDASYDAWIKLYRPDENSQNSSVSYYRKGEVVCALLDVEIRARTAGRASLDTVLAHLWQTHGATGRPVAEDGMQRVFELASGVPLGDLFEAWIHAPAELDYARTLAYVGCTLERSARGDAPACSIGVRLRSDGGRAVVSSVTRGGTAWRGGVDPGDEILAVDGVRVEGTNVDAALRGHSPGTAVDLLLARDGRVVTVPVVLDGQRHDRVKIVPKADATAAARSAFAAWLGQPHPIWGGGRP